MEYQQPRHPRLFGVERRTAAQYRSTRTLETEERRKCRSDDPRQLVR